MSFPKNCYSNERPLRGRSETYLERGYVVDELQHGLVTVVDVGGLEVVPMAVEYELWGLSSMVLFQI